MVELLIYIKHKIPIIWSIIESVNDNLFYLLHGNKFSKVIANVSERNVNPKYRIKQFTDNDLDDIEAFFKGQDSERLKWFNPHQFDRKSLDRLIKSHSFIMFGVWDHEKLVGYCFLRCFLNRKCFVGRLVDKEYSGRGVGHMMNLLLYNVAWDAGFRCLSTISKNNKLVTKAHANNQSMVVLRELKDEYLLVEFLDRRNKVN